MKYEELKNLMKSCRQSEQETVVMNRKQLMDLLQEVMQFRRSKAARIHREGVRRCRKAAQSAS